MGYHSLFESVSLDGRRVPDSMPNTSEEDEPDPVVFLARSLESSGATSASGTPRESEQAEARPIDVAVLPSVEDHVFFLNPGAIGGGHGAGEGADGGEGGADDSMSRPGGRRRPPDRADSTDNTFDANSAFGRSGGAFEDSAFGRSVGAFAANSAFGPAGGAFDANSAFGPTGGAFGAFGASGAGASGGDSPIEYLLTRSATLSRELTKNTAAQARLLRSGDPKLSRIRLMIAQNFAQIAENNELLAELYDRDRRQNDALTATLRTWETRRLRLLAKIQAVKHPQHSKYGVKLAALADQSAEVDAEIAQMELRLAALRAKQAAVQSEIEDTSLVLESRTAAYIEEFRRLEASGERTIGAALAVSGVSPDQQVVARVPVDVTFGSTYRRHRLPGVASGMPGAPAAPKPAPAAPTPAPAAPTPAPAAPTPAPAAPAPASAAAAAAPAATSAAPTGPYAQGFQRGATLSLHAKQHLASLVAGIFTPRAPRPTLDDHQNTVTEMLDLTPVLKLLEARSHALANLQRQLSQDARHYRDYEAIWRDVVSLLGHMEATLYGQISASGALNVLPTLQSCLEQVTLRFEVLVESSKHNQESNPLFAVLLNEIGAVATAMSLVTGDESHLLVLTELERRARIQPLATPTGAEALELEVRARIPLATPTGDRAAAEREVRAAPRPSAPAARAAATGKNKQS